MPKILTETYGGGDTTWLGSLHAISNARTVIVDISEFTPATHYPDGYIKSGTPVAIVGGVAVPYVVAEATSTGAGVLAGFILFDQRVVGGQDFAAPLLSHGRVITAKVPYAAFVKPVAAAKNATTIDFA